MATIGLDRLYYAKITEDAEGNETYDDPVQLAKAISADLSVELAEATLYADDAVSEVVKEFKSGTISLGVDDIGAAAAHTLTGAIWNFEWNLNNFFKVCLPISALNSCKSINNNIIIKKKQVSSIWKICQTFY